MRIVIVWWVWMQIVGWAAWPLAYRFFRPLPDRGYAFARPLGLLLSSYILWLGASLGLLRNSFGGALSSILLVAVLSWILYRRGRQEGEPGAMEWLKTHWRLALAVELVFAVAWALWALLRAYSPDLTTAGGEKFMEIMYLNSIGRSEVFPPHDAWLSNYAISYYYFGYVMMAMLTMLSGFAAHLTFNVGVALLFALTCTGSFGLVYNLVKSVADSLDSRPVSSRPIAWGVVGAVLVAVLGNQEGFLEVLYSARLLPESFWRWLDIKDINQAFDPSLSPSLMPSRSGWWWWRASRVIHDLDPQGNSMGIQPIDEFPGFSFLLGDMHPHVLALPFVLLALAIALRTLWQVRQSHDVEGGGAQWWAPIVSLPLLVPLCLGGLGFLNTWDFPIYWLMVISAYALGRWPKERSLTWSFVRDVVLTGVAIVVGGFVLYLPFYLGFQSQAGGLLPTLYVGTRFRQYVVMFAPFLVILTVFLFVQVWGMRRHVPDRDWLRDWVLGVAAFVVLPLVLMFLIGIALLVTPQGREMLDGIRRVPAVYDIVGDAPWLVLMGRLLLVKLRTWVMPVVVASLASLGVVLLLRSVGVGTKATDKPALALHPSIQFVLLCLTVGFLLTLSVEFVYLVDNFRVRMNTIFKFYFQAWVLLALAAAFAAYWVSRGKDWLRRGALAAFWITVGLGMVYPVLGNISRAGNFAHKPTLDGSLYLSTSQPDDYAAIAWLNEHVTGAPVILEAPGSGGSSYVYEGRISALTGLPTLLGWAGHEGQWRGNYEIQQSREPDIETIYNTLDVDSAQLLLQAYDIEYVYVGSLERSKYDPRGLEKFGRFLDVVYEQGDVTIYRRTQ